MQILDYLGNFENLGIGRIKKYIQSDYMNFGMFFDQEKEIQILIFKIKIKDDSIFGYFWYKFCV